MLTGELRSQVDQIWNAFWSGGVSNPLSVIEQITYLLFIKRLDDLHTREEHKAAMLGLKLARRIFPEGSDLACRNLPFLAVFHIPGFWLLNDVKKALERVVRV